MLKKIALTVAALGMLAAGMAPLASAASVEPAASGNASLNACENGTWTFSRSEGYGSGCFTNNATHINGTVHDTKSDGRCPYIRGHLSNGGWLDSNWATGNGTVATVDIWAPSGTSFTSATWGFIYC
ncbi:hypothetical protein ACWC5I_31300 [Kitasatospora sp. NPDC001574]